MKTIARLITVLLFFTFYNFSNCYAITTQVILCQGDTVVMPVEVGSGTWTVYVGNPSAITFANDTISSTLVWGFPTSSGFSNQTTYTFFWTSGGNTDTVDVILNSYTYTMLGISPVLINLTESNIPCSGPNTSNINLSVSGGVGPYTYIWSNTAADTNSISGLAVGTYAVTVTDRNGCTNADAASVSTCINDIVWPGDADNNRIVDNNDLLPIGLGYDSTGSIRPVNYGGDLWEADSVGLWAYYFTSYSPPVNYDHADCNGDGIINADDTFAIVQNFGLTHPKAGGISEQWRSGVSALYVVASRDTLYSGDSLTVTFLLGDTALPLTNFYGLAFTYDFDPLLVDSTYTEMNFVSSSWIGTTSDKISIVKIFNSGQIKAAVTRIDHTTKNGNGAIAVAKFRIPSQSSSTGSYPNIGVISEVTAIDQHGNHIPLNAGTDTTIVKTVVNSIREITNETLLIQPNPAHDRVLITAGSIINELLITNVMGQEVINSKTINSNTANLDISDYDSGIYFIQVKTDRGVAVAKLIVER